MKKNILKSGLLLTIIGGFTAACSVEQVPQTDGNQTVKCLELSASLADVQTKTSLGAEPDFNVLWSAGDQISVNGILSNAVAEEDHNKTSVRFRVEGTLTAPFNVLYPGTTEKNVIVLPATQNYFADNYDPAAYAAYGKVGEKDGEYTATLNNFCGLVRFALNGSATLTKIEVNALGGEKLHGTFTLTDAFDGTFTGGTAGTLTYNFGEGLKLSETDQYVYIALPAQTYSAGVEAKVYQADGAFMRLKFWGDGEDLAGSDLRAFASKTYAAGRVEELVGIGDLVAENGGSPSVPVSIKVALFNTMRFDEDYRPSAALSHVDHTKNTKALWRPEGAIASSNEAMREAFGKVIYNTQADIIGFNEVEETMNEYSDENSVQKLAEAQGCNYEYVFFSSSAAGWWEQFTGGTGKLSFANGFAYNADVLTLNDSGRAWYNDSNSNNYSTLSDSGSGDPNRTYVWAKFTHKESGKEFYFFVTQLPTSASGNTKAANGINNFAQSKAGSAPQILVGDMNNADDEDHECYEGSQKLMTYWTDAYYAVDEAGNLGSFYKTYSGTQSGTGKTYQYSILDFCKNRPERRIDRIFTKGGCSATTYKTIRNTYTVHYTGEVTANETQVKTDEEGNAILDANGEKETEVVQKTYSIDEDVACYPSDHLAVVCDITLD